MAIERGLIECLILRQVNRREFSRSAAASLAWLWLGGMPLSHRAAHATGNPDTILRDRLIVLRSSTQQPPLDFSGSRSQFLARQLATYSYIASFAGRADVLTPAELKTAVHDIETLLKGDPELGPFVQNGVKELFYSSEYVAAQGALDEAADFLPGAGAFVGAVGTALTKLPHPQAKVVGSVSQGAGAALIAGGLAASAASDLIPAPRIDDEYILGELVKLATARLLTLAKSDGVGPAIQQLLGRSIVVDSTGVDIEATEKGIRDSLPPDYRDIVDKAIEASNAEASAEREKKSAELLQALHDQTRRSLADFQQSVADEVLSRLEKREEAAREAARSRARAQAEIDGAAQLVSFFASSVFGRETGEALAAMYDTMNQAAKLFSQFVDNSIGGFALAGGLAGILQKLLRLFGGDPDEKFRKYVAYNLRAIGETLSTVRREMHRLFGQVLKNQAATYEEIRLGFQATFEELQVGHRAMHARFKLLRDRVDALAAYEEADDRAAEMIKFERQAEALRTEYSDPPDQRDSGRIQGALEFFFVHSTLTSARPAFTRSEVAAWEPTAVLTALGKEKRLDLGIGIVPALTQAFAGRQVAVPANPLEWARGAQAFAEGTVLFPTAVEKKETRRRVSSIREVGEGIEGALQLVLERETIGKIVTYYESLVEKLLGVIDATEENFHKTLLDRPVAKFWYDYNLGTGFDKPRQLGRDVNPGNIFLFLPDRNVLGDGIRSGFLDLVSVTKGDRQQTSPDGKRRWYEKYEVFHIHFLEGELEGQVFGEGPLGWEFVRHSRSGVPAAAAVDPLDPPVTPFPLPKGFAPWTGFISRDLVLPLALGKYQITHEHQLLRVIAKEMALQPDLRYRVRQELMQEIGKAVRQEMQVLADPVGIELQAAGASIAYLAGLDAWYRGTELGVASLLAGGTEVFGFSEATVAKDVFGLLGEDGQWELPERSDGSGRLKQRISDFLREAVWERPWAGQVDAFVAEAFPQTCSTFALPLVSVVMSSLAQLAAHLALEGE